MFYYTTRITASDGKGNKFYNFRTPLSYQYEYDTRNIELVKSKNEKDLMQINLDQCSNKQIEQWVKDCEDFTPQNPFEEMSVKAVHAVLCARLQWKPKTLSH